MRKTILLTLSALTLASCSLLPTPVVSSSGSTSASSSTPYTPTSFPSVYSSAQGDVAVKDLPTKQRTFYQLLVYSFADGDDDGIGDFKGIIDHLDYLEGLGIGGIWLSPIHPCASYHAYDVVDYYGVNAEYEVYKDGVKYDLSKLLEACHARGIKVLMDLVLNHTYKYSNWKNEHPNWFKGPNAFVGDMIDLDYDNQDVRNEVKNVGKYWLSKGVDGFRLDAAKWIYNYGSVNGGADDNKNYLWWQEFYNACKTVKPDVYMIGEVLSDGNLRDDRSYYQTMMDSNFNFEMRDVMINAAKYSSPNNYIQLLPSFQQEIRGYNAASIEASCISNHDLGRFNQRHELSPAQTALAGMMNILAPGDSYVYYGEELGLTGTCSGTRAGYYEDLNYRTPMPFASGRTIPNDYLTSYVPGKSMTSVTASGNTADADMASPTSIYDAYSRAIKAKNRAKTLYSGAVKASGNGGDSSIGSFVTTLGSDANTVIFNTGSSAKSLTISSSANLVGEAALAAHNALEGTTLYLQPYSCVILDKDVTLSNVRTLGGGSSSSSSGAPSSSEPAITLTPDEFGSNVVERKSGSLTVHVYIGDIQKEPKVYAWADTAYGVETFTSAWPGNKMQITGSNWYGYTFGYDQANIIFNWDGGQTVDLYRNKGGTYWFVPEKGSGKLSGNWYTEKPCE